MINSVQQPARAPAAALPDTTISARDVFKIDSDLQVPAFAVAEEHVPARDPDYVFDRDTTLALLAGFLHNRRVMVQGRQRYESLPGRLNALEHIVLKEADVPWRRARVALGLLLHDDMLKENIDGEAVIWAHNRLRARHERRRILVVVSDGTPMDEATLAADGHEYLERHLQSVVTAIETRSPVQLAAIGIGHDVSLFYSNATRLVRIDDLGPALSLKLIELLGGAAGAPGPRRRIA